MKAIERHRQSWQGKSDEWLFERLDTELKHKVEEIHRLLAENETLRQFDVIRRSEILIDFLSFLNENGYINDYDFVYETQIKKFIKQIKTTL